jgi:hypothetical protein
MDVRELITTKANKAKEREKVNDWGHIILAANRE